MPPVLFFFFFQFVDQEKKRRWKRTFDGRKKGDVMVDGFSEAVGIYFVRNEGERIVNEIKIGLENIDCFFIELFIKIKSLGLG